MKLWPLVAIGSMFWVSACCGSKQESTGENGSLSGNAVVWKGDAAACNAIKSCCGVTSDTALMCTLTAAGSDVNGDCGKGLPKVRTYIKEKKYKAPAGCM